MSLTLSGVWSLSLHLDLFNSIGRYSLTSRFQKWLTICCTFFQDLKLAGSWLSNFPGVRELNGLLIRKWFDVRGISFSGRSATIVSGLEFNIASVSTKIVLNTSSDNLLEHRMINRVSFAVYLGDKYHFFGGFCRKKVEIFDGSNRGTEVTSETSGGLLLLTSEKKTRSSRRGEV